MCNPQGSRKIRKAKVQLEEKHINSSWGKELRPIARDTREWKVLVDSLCS
jgi:hypothetical protein